MTRMLALLMVATVVSASAAAAQPPAPPAPPAAPAAPAPPPAPPAPPEVGQAVNIRVVLTITDERAGQAPETKRVSLIAADRQWGRVRADGLVMQRGAVPVQLHVDARPQLLEGGRLRLELILQHQLVDGGAEAATHPTKLSESFTVFLDSGKPLSVSEAVDPATGRKTTVEVVATVLQ